MKKEDIRSFWIQSEKYAELKKDQEESYEYLLNQFETFFTNPRDISEIHLTTNELLEKAVENNLISKENEENLFKNKSSFIAGTVHYLSAKLIVPKINDLEQLLEEIRKINHKSSLFGLKKELTFYLLLYLNDSLSIYLSELIYKAIDKDLKVFPILYSFLECLPHFDKLDKESLKEVFPKIAKHTERFINDGDVYKSVEDLAQTKKNLAKEILEAYEQNNEEYKIRFIPSLALGYWENDYKSIIEYAENLIETNKPAFIKKAILILGNFNQTSYSENPEYLNQTFELFKDLESLKDDEINSHLILGGRLLLEIDERAKKLILRLSDTETDLAHYHLSNVIFLAKKDFPDQDFLKNILFDLTNVRSKNTRITRNIDNFLFEKGKQEPSLIINFYKQWITQRSDNEIFQKNKFTEIFDGSLRVLLENHSDKFGGIILDWFNTEDPRFHQSAAELVSFHPSQPELPSKKLAELPSWESIYIGRKILGYVIESKKLCSLIYSFLELRKFTESFDDKIKNFIKSSFTEYIVYNFPGDSKEFLQSKLRKNENKSLIKDILNEQKKYQDRFDELEELTEFESPYSRIKPYLIARKKVLQKAFDRAEKQSIFRQVVNNISIKNGSSFFTIRDGELSPKSEFGKISHSYEMPSGEFIDPLGQHYTRYKLRTEKKNDLQ